jgi:ferredoxin
MIGFQVILMTDWLPMIDRQVCIGCGECVAQCPTHALGQWQGKAALVTPHLCIYCADCETLCPSGAIQIPYLICKEESEK